MLTYNVGFINNEGNHDETQLDIEERNRIEEEVVELINLILSLKNEMGIKEVTYIDLSEVVNDVTGEVILERSNC